MSAYAVSQLSAAPEAVIIADLTHTHPRPANGHAIAGGASGAISIRRAGSGADVALIDLEPHWLTAVDAATD